MNNIPSPKCVQSLNYILGYLAWKRDRIFNFENEAMIKNGFFDVRSNRINDDFYWKETRWKESFRNECHIKERYHYFTLDSKFNNSEFSYTTEEENLVTGLTETVTYKIEPTNGSVENTIISELEKRTASLFPDYATTGATSIAELQQRRPVPLLLRVWDLRGPSGLPYKIAGRLTGKSNTTFTLEQPSTTTKDGVVNFAVATRTYERMNVFDNSRYINSTDIFEYEQNISNIILYGKYMPQTFTTKKINETSSLTRLYTYRYNRINKNYTLKRAAERKRYAWNDPNQRKASIEASGKQHFVIKARVRRTTSNGCTAVYRLGIGEVKTTEFGCDYYTVPSNKSKIFEPQDLNSSLNKYCKKTNMFDTLSSYDPFSNAFRLEMDKLLPRRDSIFGNEGEDDLLDQTIKTVDATDATIPPPDGFSTCGNNLTNGTLVSSPDWTIINYSQ